MSARRREDPPWVELERWCERARSDGPWPRLWIVRGDERWFSVRAYEALAAAARERGAEWVVHDGADPDFQLPALLGDLATPSLFSPRQVLVARGVDVQLRKAGKQQPPLVAAVQAFLERDEPERCLALFADKLRADHVLFKAATQGGAPTLHARKLWDTPPPWRPDPRQAELVQWLVAEARRRDVRLSPDDAVVLVRCTGNDLGALVGELERLRARGPGALREDLRFRAAGSPFAVADSVLSGSTGAALSGLEGLYRGGMAGRDGERVLDTGAIGALLVRAVSGGLRQGLTASTVLARGAAPEEAAQAAGAQSERARGALLERVRRIPDPAVWGERLEQLADLERRHKGGQGLGPDDWARLVLSWAVRERNSG